MLLFFAVFLVCGWLVILLDSSYVGTRHRVPALIGPPMFAALCCFVAFVPLSGSAGRATLAPEDVFLVLYTLLAFLCALGGVIAVPIALRSRFRERQDAREANMAQHHHDHSDHAHGSEMDRTHRAVRATWIPRGRPPREE